jgi:hypothetical protein
MPLPSATRVKALSPHSPKPRPGDRVAVVSLSAGPASGVILDVLAIELLIDRPGLCIVCGLAAFPNRHTYGHVLPVRARNAAPAIDRMFGEEGTA